MKIREYIGKIVAKGQKEDMDELSEMLDELICDLKEKNPKLYKRYKEELYELANGKVLTEEMAYAWVEEMKPEHEHWTIEETTKAMNNLNYNCDKLDYYVVVNMMYNDYYDIVKDDEELALKMAYHWLKDEDSLENKLYNYWKYVIKR